jgi:hypothetical protein
VARLAALLALAVVLLTGCAGADAGRAQELLAASEAAAAGLKTAAYAGELELRAEGQDVVARLRVAVRQRGGRPVAQHVRFAAGGQAAEVVVRDGRAWARTGGDWQPVPLGQAAAFDAVGPGLAARLLDAIDDVSVDEGAVVAGEPSATVKVVLDGV